MQPQWRSSMINILVTGGVAYIGYHACKSLASAGFTPARARDLGTLLAFTRHVYRDLRWKPAHTEIGNTVETACAWRNRRSSTNLASA